jgi:hypothetical protein
MSTIIDPTAGIIFSDSTTFSSTNQLGLRNRLINGNPLINQTAVSGTVILAAAAYGHDMWKAGAGGCTYTFATVNNVVTITISAGTLQQIIEGINLQSGTHVLSWFGTSTARIDSGSYSASGVTGTAVGGTNQTIEFGVGTFSKAQYEQASIPSSFEVRPYGVEFAMCQRYYETIPANHFNQEFYSTGGLSCHVNQAFKVTKRATPTVAEGTISSQNLSSGRVANGTPYGIDLTWAAASGAAYLLYTGGSNFTANARL